MLIGLISDTHIQDRARELPKNVISSFENVDLILHAGDLTSTKVIDELEKIAPTIADTQQLLYLAKQLDADILVTGHSHQPKIEQIDGVLLLNPGSPVVPRLADRTVMLLEINNKEVDVEVIKIGNPVCSTLDLDKFKGE